MYKLGRGNREKVQQFMTVTNAREAEGKANISTDDKEAHKFLHNTLKTMALEFAEYQVCAVIFLTTQSYVDIASISISAPYYRWPEHDLALLEGEGKLHLLSMHTDGSNNTVSELKSRSLYSEYFLGFVHSTKEYKVVSIHHRMRFLTFDICTIGTPSWRIARESAELLKTTKAVIVNDSMYWLLLHEASSLLCQEILMLNLTDVKFSKIALPNAVEEHDLALLEGEGKLHLLSMPADGSNNTVSDIWVVEVDCTEQIWFRLEIVSPWVSGGMSKFFLWKMKIFYGSQDILFCVDLLGGTFSYICMASGESLISCGMFVESFAPVVKGLLNSTASSSSPGAGSSLSVLRWSFESGWSTTDLELSLERARRTVNMEWKISKRGLVISP